MKTLSVRARRAGLTGRPAVLAAALQAAALLAAVSSVAGCSRPVAGTWEDAHGIATYEFQADGRARIDVLGARVAAEYTLDGDKVLITSPQGTVVLRRRDDRLYGPTGLELVRQSE